MHKRKWAVVSSVVLLILAGFSVLWLGKMRETLFFNPSPDPSRQDAAAGPSAPPPRAPDAKEGRDEPRSSLPGAAGPGGAGLSATRPDALREEGVIPPAPPLPDVPLESSQKERREAFELKESVDHIVTKEEPFEVGGRRMTIEGMQKGLDEALEPKPVLPTILEREIGPSIRKPVVPKVLPRTATSYYGVRVIRPTENIWNIHYAILKEYMKRRGIELAAFSDEPTPEGKSSGVGRLLKFIENAVLVYNLAGDRFENDLNAIRPHSIVVFFKISHLFEALDRLEPDDLRWLRYVDNSLRLDKPDAQRQQILDKRTLQEPEH